MIARLNYLEVLVCPAEGTRFVKRLLALLDSAELYWTVPSSSNSHLFLCNLPAGLTLSLALEPVAVCCCSGDDRRNRSRSGSLLSLSALVVVSLPSDIELGIGRRSSRAASGLMWRPPPFKSEGGVSGAGISERLFLLDRLLWDL